jgi:exonuclease SbcC
LLESLTRTSIYSELGKLVHDEVQGRERSLEIAEQALAHLPVLPPEDLERLGQALVADEAAAALLREQRDTRRQAWETARRRADLESNRERLDAERTAWRAEWEGSAAGLEQLRRHRQAVPLVASLTRWQETVRLEEARSRAWADAAARAEEARLAWETFAGPHGPGPDGDTALAQDLGSLEGLFAVHAEALSRFGAMAPPQPLPDAASVRAEREALLRHGDEEATQVSLREAIRREQALVEQRHARQERDRAAARRDDAARQLAALARTLEDATDAAAAARTEARSAAELEASRLQTLEALRRIASLESHRSRLADGEPCPLCGSREHPWATGPVPDDVAAAEAACADATGRRVASVERLHRAERDAATGFARAQDLTAAIDAAAAELDRFDALLPPLTFDEIEQAIAEARREVASCQHRLGRLRHLQDAEQWLQAREQAEAAASRLADRLRAHGISLPEDGNAAPLQTLLHRRIEAFRGYQSHLRDTVSLATARDAAGADREAWETALAAEVASHGFESIEALRAALLSPEEGERWSALETRLRESGKALEARWQDCLEALAVLKAHAEASPGDAESLAAALHETEEALTGTVARLQLGRQRLAADAENRQLHAARSAALAAERSQLQVWHRLRHLIGDAAGKKFRTFAQGISLDLMVRHANRHLARLTARYQLRRAAGSELGLEIEDAYQAGTRRPTASLSGGESFLASLALALALSDLAGRNVRIDSLFIDEGFGSLDAEALEIALCALESLRQQDKLVGVISHVGLLQERIGTRITLEKRPDGTSSLEICAA